MRGEERRTGETSIGAGTEYALNSSRCTRRGFVEGVGVAGTVGGLGGFSEVAPASSAAEVASASPLSQHWSTALSGTVQDYLIAPDLVYVVTRDGMVRSLGLETGKETNRLDLGASIRPYGLSKDGQYLAVGLANGRLKIIDAESFSEEQTLPFDGDFIGATAKGGAVFLATSSGVQRISLPDGEVKWRFDKNAASPIWTTSEGLAVRINQIFHILTEDAGDVVWKRGVGGRFDAKTGNWLEDSDNRCWGLTELESHFFVATPFGGYDFLNKFTGERLWKVSGNGAVNRAVGMSDRVIHQVSSSIISRKFDGGEVQWETDIVVPHAKGMVIYDGSLVVFGMRKSDDADVMMALDPSSRAIKRDRKVDGPIGLVSTIGNAMFGVNLETDEMRAYLPENAQMDIPESPTPTSSTGTQTDAGTPAPAGTATRTGETTGSPSGSEMDAQDGRPERGFFTNGEGSVFGGLSGGNTVTIASILVTGVSMVLTLLQLIRGK